MNQKGNILIFLLVGIVIIAAIGGTFYLGKIANKSKPTEPMAASTPAPQSTPIPSATPVPTGTDKTVYTEATRSANWKTYISKSFSFKYPPTFFLVPPDPDRGGTSDLSDSQQTYEDFYSNKKPLKKNSLLVSFLGDNFTGARDITFEKSVNEDMLQEMVDESVGRSQVPYQKITISGVVSAKFINDGMITYIVPFTKWDSIRIWVRPEDSELLTIFDQILSTFKFTQ